MTDAKMILGGTAVVVVGLLAATLLQEETPTTITNEYIGVTWDGDCKVASLDPLPDTIVPGGAPAHPMARNAAGEPIPAVIGLVRSATEYGSVRVVATGQGACGGLAERRTYIDPAFGVEMKTPEETVRVPSTAALPSGS